MGKKAQFSSDEEYEEDFEENSEENSQDSEQNENWGNKAQNYYQ